MCLRVENIHMLKSFFAGVVWNRRIWECYTDILRLVWFLSQTRRYSRLLQDLNPTIWILYIMDFAPFFSGSFMINKWLHEGKMFCREIIEEGKFIIYMHLLSIYILLVIVTYSIIIINIRIACRHISINIVYKLNCMIYQIAVEVIIL